VGTLNLEFGTLSRLTGDPRFEETALRTARAVWAQRTRHDLLGAHIDLTSGAWTQVQYHFCTYYIAVWGRRTRHDFF